MKKNKISKNWLNKKHKDPFFIKSKLQGYRSRAAYKLIEINNKFKFLNKNTILLDLGSSPGGWSQVASDIIKKGKILSVDILEMENIRNVNFLKGDFLSEEIFEKIRNFFNNKVLNLICDNDPAFNFTVLVSKVIFSAGRFFSIQNFMTLSSSL